MKVFIGNAVPVLVTLKLKTNYIAINCLELHKFCNQYKEKDDMYFRACTVFVCL